MKEKSAFLSWVFAVLTSGLYAFYWLISRTDTINALAGKRVFDGKRHVWPILLVLFVVLSLWVVYLSTYTDAQTDARWLMVPIGIGTVFYLGFVIRAFLLAGRAIREIEIARDIAKKCSPFLSWFLLFAYATNVPYLQVHINRLISAYD